MKWENPELTGWWLMSENQHWSISCFVHLGALQESRSSLRNCGWLRCCTFLSSDHDEYRPPVWKSYCKYWWNNYLLFSWKQYVIEILTLSLSWEFLNGGGVLLADCALCILPQCTSSSRRRLIHADSPAPVRWEHSQPLFNLSIMFLWRIDFWSVDHRSEVAWKNLLYIHEALPEL